MKTLSADLLAVLASKDAVRVNLYEIGPLQNGAMIYATDGSGPITFEGNVYDPVAYGDWSRGSITTKIGLESSSCALTVFADNYKPVTFPGTSGAAQLLDGFKLGLGDNAPVTIYTAYMKQYGELTGPGGLVGWWKLNEGTGTTAVDSSPSGANGTWAGSPTGATGYYSPGYIYPEAGCFDGYDNVVTTGEITTGHTVYAISAWVLPRFTAAGRYHIAGVGDYLASISTDPTGTQYQFIANDSTLTGIVGGTVTPGVWQHVLATYDGTNATLYVNGQCVAGPSPAPTGGPIGVPLYIGAPNAPVDPYLELFWKGLISDVRLYSEIPSAGDIAWLASGTPPMSDTPGSLVETKFIGEIGEIKPIGYTKAEITVNDLLYLLNAQTPQMLLQASCRWVLYSAGCTLNAADFARAGSVGTVLTGMSFNPASNLSLVTAEGTFTQGYLTWTIGPNTGLSSYIAQWTPGTGGARDVITFDTAPIFPIAAGHAFTIHQGCNKTYASCNQLQGSTNAPLNYGGTPNVPVPESAI